LHVVRIAKEKYNIKMQLADMVGTKRGLRDGVEIIVKTELLGTADVLINDKCTSV
jgi:hypothetical protein